MVTELQILCENASMIRKLTRMAEQGFTRTGSNLVTLRIEGWDSETPHVAVQNLPLDRLIQPYIFRLEDISIQFPTKHHYNFLLLPTLSTQPLLETTIATFEETPFLRRFSLERVSGYQHLILAPHTRLASEKLTEL
jgi:hypothetical protein